ncbi:hypothetical protein ACAX61_03185 [Sphingomonas sp. IW22]
MAPFMIAAFAVVVVGVMSVRANRKFRAERRLPMQWWLDGSVTWTAPRRWALAFMPGLAFVTLSTIAIISVTMSPRPGQEGLAVPGIALFGTTFVAIHALHLWLIGRTISARG